MEIRDFLRPIIKIKDFIIYDIPYGIKNIIKWFPVIWKDRNWDSYYIFLILKKKLELTEKCLRYGHLVGQEKRADKIKVCISIIDRIIKDDYYENSFINHDKKWGELEVNWGFKDNKKCTEIKFFRCNVKTEKDKDIERRESKSLYKHAGEMKMQDINYLFKIISKHISGWWD